MDTGNSSAWPIIVADWLDRCLSFWHQHRMLATGLVVSCALIVLAVRRRYAGPNRGHDRIGSPASEEKAAWLLDRHIESATEKLPQTQSTPAPEKVKSAKNVAAKIVAGRKPKGKLGDTKALHGDRELRLQPLIFYSSLTGTTERLTRAVTAQLNELSNTDSRLLQPQVHDLSDVDLDEFFISGPMSSPTQNVQSFYLLLIPSYDIDTNLNLFLEHLNETHNDFRIDTAPLSKLAGYSVFGIGDKQGWPSEKQGYCAQAVQVDKWMAKLTGRKRAYPLGLGDVKSDLEISLQDWCSGLSTTIADLIAGEGLGEGVSGSGDAVESEEENADDDFPDSGRRKRQKTLKAADVEDLGGKRAMSKVPLAIDFTTHSPSTATPLKAMVPKESPTHAALTKQGYTIVGSHSGVKICRWTKSALRGRGSCYKNSFYGIASHLCMETTPSLSCSNKCVFCWRHGTNPVSTTWRWQVDDPQMIFDGAKEGHYKKIKMMRGVPGVRSERFEEAMRIRHCALSLVGEPIFYPHINEFVDLLHGERISSFLVCNAQHPQQLNDLKRVTQLYVSIDASNKDSLRKIDRPLHRDFWERFQSCLDILKEKRYMQRTVFRLTLVKGFNVEDEAEGYADLIQCGLPCFIEIKGVTYCGTSSAAGAGLTMQNVPFYEEVITFAQALNAALAKRGLEYGIAAEHEHSCCILLASDRFRIAGKWHTIINYTRFFELLESGTGFTPEDYCSETPEWALWGNGGFDPRDQRVDRKGRPKELPVSKKQIEY